MGRPLGSRNKPKDEDEAGIGDNSEVKELTPGQKRSLLMDACERIGPLKNELAALGADMRGLYKSYKEDGIPKKDIDLALALRKMGSAEVLAMAEHTAQIIEWVHPGVQAEMAFEVAAE
jgi:uncharacterized protein (UPF0335 family)